MVAQTRFICMITLKLLV